MHQYYKILICIFSLLFLVNAGIYAQAVKKVPALSFTGIVSGDNKQISFKLDTYTLSVGGLPSAPANLWLKGFGQTDKKYYQVKIEGSLADIKNLIEIMLSSSDNGSISMWGSKIDEPLNVVLQSSPRYNPSQHATHGVMINVK